jgi:hypothetical protein
MPVAEPTLGDIVWGVLRKYPLETEKDSSEENAAIFADELYRQAFRWPIENVAEGAGEQNYLLETDPRWRSPLQERVRGAVAAAIQWWWDDQMAEMRADAGGRAVADLIEPWMVHQALQAAKRGPKLQVPLPPEIAAAYAAEQRWRDSH